MHSHRNCWAFLRPEPTSLSVQYLFYVKHQKNSIIKLWLVGSGRIIILSLRANAVKRGNPVKNKAKLNWILSRRSVSEDGCRGRFTSLAMTRDRAGMTATSSPPTPGRSAPCGEGCHAVTGWGCVLLFSLSS